MTREEKAIMYFKDMRKKFCEDYLLGIPKDSVAYKATMAEKEFYDTAIEALEQEPYEDWYDVPSNEMNLEQARRAVRDLRKKLVEHLEQEPSGDLISRQTVKMQMIKYGFHSHFITVKEFVKDLPSVNPQPTGHWIEREEYDADRWKCSECGRTEQYQENFCPNCGADMRGEQNG